MKDAITLREITEDDLPILCDQQLDPIANQMAAVPARDRDAFMLHWRTKLFGHDTVVTRAIIVDSQVVGHLLSWEEAGKRFIGYWIGRDYWGKGIATKALGEFLGLLEARPLYARVAQHNIASAKVLEKSGFVLSSRNNFFSKVHEREIEEIIFVYA